MLRISLPALVNFKLYSELLSFSFARRRVIPMGFSYPQLPPMILDWQTQARLESTELKVLTINQLPNLKKFSLLLHMVQLEDGLLFEVKERVQNTLQIAELDRLKSDGNPSPITAVRITVVKLT